jgi:hypothetical protein
MTLSRFWDVTQRNNAEDPNQIFQVDHDSSILSKEVGISGILGNTLYIHATLVFMSKNTIARNGTIRESSFTSMDILP